MLPLAKLDAIRICKCKVLILDCILSTVSITLKDKHILTTFYLPNMYFFTNTHGQQFIHIQYLAIMNGMYVYVHDSNYCKTSNTYTLLKHCV